jgi:hypothetical protein
MKTFICQLIVLLVSSLQCSLLDGLCIDLAYLVASCCCFIAAIISLIVSSFTKNVDYYVPAAEVERIENERYALLEKHLKKD